MEELKLEDGMRVTLRSPVSDDAEKLLGYLDVVRAETEWLAFGARDALPTVERERDWIARMTTGPRARQILVEADGEPVALAGVNPVSEFAKLRHAVVFGVSVRRDFWGRGIGRMLGERLLDWCRAQTEIRLVVLGVYADNTRARALYGALGFVEDGAVPGAIGREDGSFTDDVRMSCFVGETAGSSPVETGFAPLAVELADGREVTVRAAVPDDAQAIQDYMRETIGEMTRFIMNTPDEQRRMHADVPTWIASVDPAAGELWMMAFDGERVVGSLNCHTLKRKRRAHVGQLGMTLEADYRGQGLGTAMLGALVDWAERHPVLEMLLLSVYADNARAISLYRRCGFVEAGRVPRETKFGPGDYRDEVTMWRDVSGQGDGSAARAAGKSTPVVRVSSA